MTKAEAFVEAWRLAANGDFSLVDQIYHPQYSFQDEVTGIIIRLETDKRVAASIHKNFLHGPYRIIHESDVFLCLQRYAKNRFADAYHNVVTAITYLEGKIITQESFPSGMGNDPSKGKNWNWEDYE